MRRLARLGLLLPLMWLVACTHTTKPEKVAEPEQAWQQHALQLQKLLSWELSGRVMVSTADDSGQLTMHWAQQDSHYDIRLIAPFGQGSVRLQGRPGKVRMDSSDFEKPLLASDAEQLLQRHLGMQVPLQAMRFWLRGLPAPGPHHYELNEYGHIARLQQGEWDITMSKYREVAGVSLPYKVRVSGKRTRVNLVVGSWHLQAEDKGENG